MGQQPDTNCGHLIRNDLQKVLLRSFHIFTNHFKNDKTQKTARIQSFIVCLFKTLSGLWLTYAVNTHLHLRVLFTRLATIVMRYGDGGGGNGLGGIAGIVWQVSVCPTLYRLVGGIVWRRRHNDISGNINAEFTGMPALITDQENEWMMISPVHISILKPKCNMCIVEWCVTFRVGNVCICVFRVHKTHINIYFI